MSASAAAASPARLGSFHRIDAQASGLTTESTELPSIRSLSATHSASAPPLPPSPVTTLTMGTARPLMARRLRAMASPCPRSSAPTPQ